VFIYHRYFFGDARAAGQAAAASFIRWKTEDIVILASRKGRFTVPGQIVNYAYPVEPFESFFGSLSAEIPPTEVGYYQTTAQEFKVVNFELETKHTFNRRTGKYTGSDVRYKHDDGTRHDGFEFWSIPNLTRAELREYRR
jgi:hypothetical protein